MLESNAFAPPTVEGDFRDLCYAEGQEIVALSRTAPSPMPAELSAFITEMDKAGDWEPVPILVTAAEPGGPIDQAFLDRLCTLIAGRLAEAGPVDGAYFAAHGGMTATGETDPDGRLWHLVREAIGPATPLVATVDLHANISDIMAASVDALIAYRTNPHVDQAERAGEAARHLLALMAGEIFHTAFLRLPIVPPTVTLLTASGPYADMIDFGQAERTQSIRNVSVVGGFAFADTPKNGIAVLVTATDKAEAEVLCARIAAKGWDDRARFSKQLTPIEDAVRLALDPQAPPHIYADVADNPGGGGRGTTTDLLRALLEAGAQGVLYGNFVDPDLAAEAHERGVGAQFEARFNRDGGDGFSRPLTHRAEVVGLHDGSVVGSRGLWAGRQLDLGPTAALDLGGVTVVVSTMRKQCADPVFFTMLGLDPAEAKTVTVKSRGHFRAGFDLLFPSDRTLEIDGPGLTSPILSRFDFKHLPRPVFPLDAEADWTPPGWARAHLD
jgi:microcystin degradation protein MlrC